MGLQSAAIAPSLSLALAGGVTVIATANRGGSDYDEIKAIAYDEAGYSETGACWTCELSSAAEDRADSAMRTERLT